MQKEINKAREGVSSSGESSGLGTAAIIGIVAGCVALLLMAVLVVLLFLRCLPRHRPDPKHVRTYPAPSPPVPNLPT